MGSAMAASMTPPTYTPSDAFSRMSVHMSMTHQEPFSPLTSPVFHSHYPPTSGVGADQPPGSGILGPAAMPGMSSAGDRLDSLPPPTVPSSASISAVGISRPEVTMDWLSMDASGNLVVSQAGATMHHQHQPLYQHQQQHQHPAESDFHSMFAAAASAAATANASDSPTGLTPAALMMGGGALSPADGAALQKQQQQRHSSSPVTATLTLVPPSALHSPSSPVPPGVTVARSRSTSGSPIPLGLPSAVVAAAGSSAGVPRRRTSGGMVSSSKAASKLAAAPYVRHSPRLAPVSGSPAGALGPGSPIGLGGGGGPMSPAMLPRSSLASGADMRAAIVNSPGLLPMAAVTIPATAMHGGTPHLPPTPNSAPMNPYTAGTVHSTSATPYMGGSMHGTPPLLPMVSPALHPSAYQSHTSGYYGHHQQQHGGQYPNAAAATAPLPLPSPALPPGKGLRITSVSSDSVPVSTATTQQQPPTPGFHHEPHMINLTGLGGYTTLGLGHGMLLHEFAPPAAAPSSSRRAGGTAAAGSDDDEDDEDDEGKKNTHRFAEQKRRNAMKDGFDELRRRIPGLQNSVTNRKSKFGGGAAAAPEPPEPLGAGARRRRGRDAKNEGKGISKIMVLKAAYDYCAFMSSRERRLRQTVQQLAAAANANANAVAALRAATAGIGHSVAVPEIPLTPAVPADLLQSSDDIFFTYVKETLWKSASAQTQAAGEILAVTDGPLSPRSAPSSVTDMAASVAVAPTAAMASGPQQQQLISPADSMLVDDPAAMAAALANAGSVAAAVAAISSATGSTPAVAKAVVQKVTSSSRGSSIRYQQQQQQQAQLAQQQQADT
ncbi:hypothetical protein BC828DRAFT_180217 [Blastocladiella britannica]|nr:hypothetical protein BC828DRAFT_180217 [Blastocladiella britannica]